MWYGFVTLSLNSFLFNSILEPFPSPGYLPNPGTEPRSPALQADSLPAEPPGKPCFVAGEFKVAVRTAT